MIEDSSKQGWTSGPDTRGTSDILWSCLATLALCVWTAVHPNISLNSSFRRSLISRLAMMLIAIIFLEFIISAAWRQLRSAQRLRFQMNDLLHESSAAKEESLYNDGVAKEAVEAEVLLTSNSENIPRGLTNYSSSSSSNPDNISRPTLRAGRSTGLVQSTKDIAPEPSTIEQGGSSAEKEQTDDITWTSEQGFFAVMGGFAIENGYFDPNTNTNVIMRRLVTVDGVIQLARMGMLPKISSSEIEERSKADLVAKAFVLSQIIWFGLQVIGRLLASIPVTLLETHTAVHVGCTIIIYFMWLKKPYDVQSSILLSSPEAKDMGALFHYYRITEEIHAKENAQYQRDRVTYWKNRLVHAARNDFEYDAPPTPTVPEALTTSVERYLLYPMEGYTDRSSEHILVSLAPPASRAIKLLKSQNGFVDETISINMQNWDYLRANSENFTMKAVWGGWSTDTGHEMSIDKAVHFLFNALYGGGHLAAWFSSSFPTVLEKWLWRGSAVMLVLVPIWGSLWILWWKAARSRQRWLYVIRNGDLDIIVAPFFFIVLSAYFFARSYLLIESLAGLRLLPAGAFLKVQWTKYIPHIS